MTDRTPGFSTLAIHAGAQPDSTTGARATPIYQTTSFVFEDVDHAASLFGLQTFGNIYTRIGNPTNAVLEERVPRSKAAPRAGGRLRPCRAGDRDALPAAGRRIRRRKAVRRARSISSTTFKNFGWNVVWADPDDVSSFERSVTPKTKAIFIESIANPGGVITDIEAVGKIAKNARRAAHRRQHAGDTLPVQADRLRRRHRFIR